MTNIGLLDGVVENLRYLHRRMRLANPNNKIYEVNEIVALPEGGRVLYTAQLLLSSGETQDLDPPLENPELDMEIDEEEIYEIAEAKYGGEKDHCDSFAIYRLENPELITGQSELFDHQLDNISSCGLMELKAKKAEKPGLVILARAMQTVLKPQTDIHGTEFVCLRGGKSTSIYRHEVENGGENVGWRSGENVGFSFTENSNHNYHMEFVPGKKLTTAVTAPDGDSKTIDEYVEEADIEFIARRSKDLIDWAQRVLGY